MNWKITAFTMVFGCLFVYLGLWQVDRYHEKTRLLKEARERRDQAGVPFSALPTDPAKLDGLPVSLRGSYDGEHLFLLDNRIVAGRVGFDVLTPFHLSSSDEVVLVNRGFVPMGRTRSQTPQIPVVPSGELSIEGYVYVPERNPAVSDPSTIAGSSTWPIIVQAANPVLLQRQLDASLYRYVIRLDRNDPAALPRDWPVTTITPQRHMAYAVQWFAMAIAVVAAWIYFMTRQPAHEDAHE